MATTDAHAGAKDESAAEWLAPKWLNEWHDGLAAKGLNFGATYIGDNITNVSGGTGRGAIHFGRFDFSVDADLEKLVGWTGGRFFANTLGIYGRGLSRNYVHNLATISEIEALPEARLYNAYFEQSFYNNALNIRVGQQAADVEFFDSETDDLFINGTFGWPAIKASNLPAGGPAPPIAVPGIRVKAALVGPDHRFRRGVQRQCGATGRRRPAASRQSRPGVSRQRSAMDHRAGALGLRHRHRRPSAAPAISRRAPGIIPDNSTISASRRRACRSPTPAEPASRQSFAAISASSRCWSRRFTGRPR